MADIAPQTNTNDNYSSKELNTTFGFVIGILLAVVGIKYQGSTGTTLFRKNSRAMALFVADICIYAIASIATHLRTNDQTLRPILLVSGAMACELLVFVFVESKVILWLSINVLVFLSFNARRIDFERISGPFKRVHEKIFKRGNSTSVGTITTMIDCPNSRPVCTIIDSAPGSTCVDSDSGLRTRSNWFRQAFARISCGRGTMEDQRGGGGGATTTTTSTTACLEIKLSNV